MSSISHNISYLLSMDIYHTSTIIIYISCVHIPYISYIRQSVYEIIPCRLSPHLLSIYHMNMVRVEVRMIDIEMVYHMSV